MDKYPFISIVALTWNSKLDILNLLSSIDKSDYPKNRYEVIVVDNASEDNTVIQIRKKFPKTKIISLNKNFGMPGFNYGYRKARGELIFSLQSDITVAKDFFSKVTSKFQQDPNIALLGVKVFYRKDGRFLPPTMKINFYTGIISPVIVKDKERFDYLEGLAHIFPKKLLKKAGMIDKDYFFYGDDPDISLRLKKEGLKIVYFPNTYVIHGKSKETPTYFPYKYHHFYKATFKIIYTYGNILQKISTIIVQLLIAPTYLLIFQKRNTFAQRWWGFGWNLKHTSSFTKILIISFMLGLLLRTIVLIRNDFWFDEAFTYNIAKLPLDQTILSILTDNNPPFYYLLMHFVQTIDQSQITLRLPSFISNLVSIYLIFKISKGYLNQKAAVVATSLFTLSPLAIYLSATARLHSITILLVILESWLFLKLKNNPTIKTSIYFILVSILGIYTQYYFLLMIFAFSFYLLLHKTKLTLHNWFRLLIIVGVLFLPWLILASQITHNNCSCPNSLLSLPASLVSPILAGVGEVTLRSFNTLPIYYLIIFSFTALFALLFFVKGALQKRYFTTIYLVPLILLTIVGFIFPVFSPKGFTIYSPIFFIITAIGIDKSKYNFHFSIMLLILLGLISIIEVSDPVFSGTKIRPILNIVESNKEISIAHISSLTFYSVSYYTKGRQQSILLTNNPFPNATVKYIGGEKTKIGHDINEFWLVNTQTWVDANEYTSVLNEINNQFLPTQTYDTGQLTVSLMQRKSD